MPAPLPSSDPLHHLALLLSAGTTPEELGGVVDEHGAELARVLGIDGNELHRLARMDDTASVRRLRELVTQVRTASREQQRLQRESLAAAAAGMLSRLARWHDDRVELDRQIVLGPNLVPPRAQFLLFAPDGREAVIVQARSLRRARRCLRHTDGLRVHLDDALTFEWKGGRGRLRLVHRLRIPREHRVHVFTVVLEAPRPPARRSAGCLARPGAGRDGLRSLNNTGTRGFRAGPTSIPPRTSR